MAGINLHLLVILIALSYLNAVVASRTMHPFHESQEVPALKDINQIPTAEIAEEEFPNRRMDFEHSDYPGSGANNRHTPKPPLVED